MSTPASNSPMTWAMLLGKWTDFAKASVALPDGGEAGKVKRAVPALIGLQSVTCALGEVGSLPAPERSAGLDMGEVLIRQYSAQIHELWKGEALHPGVEAIVLDAHQALSRAKAAGTGWILTQPDLVCDHPSELVATLLGEGFAGDCFLPSPGVRLFKGSPVAFVRGSISHESVRAITQFLGKGSVRTQAQQQWLQVYRQFDFGLGKAVRDVVVGEAALPPGQPLLVPAMLQGQAQPVSLPIRGASEQAPLPLVWEVDDGTKSGGCD